MKMIRATGLVLFILGAIIGIMDLLDVIQLGSSNNPFYGSLALMIAGICLTFLSQIGDR